MTRRMNRANIIFLASLAIVTFGLLEFLKVGLGAPYAYVAGACALALLVVSLLRK